MTKEEALKKYGIEIDEKGFVIEEPPIREAELFAAMDDYAKWFSLNKQELSCPKCKSKSITKGADTYWCDDCGNVWKP